MALPARFVRYQRAGLFCGYVYFAFKSSTNSSAVLAAAPEVAPEGLEHLEESPIKSGGSQKRAAKSGAVDPTLQELVNSWGELPQSVHDAVSVMVGMARQK
jgi:hypothetical protein